MPSVLALSNISQKESGIMVASVATAAVLFGVYRMNAKQKRQVQAANRIPTQEPILVERIAAKAVSSSGASNSVPICLPFSETNDSGSPISAIEPAAPMTDRARPRQKLLLDSRVITAKEAVAHAVYALSDVSFVYPGDGQIGDEMATWMKTGRKNAHSSVVQVHSLRTHDGAAAAMYGAGNCDPMHISAFATAEALLQMSTNMYRLAQARVPCVMHVTTQRMMDDCSIVGSDSAVMRVRDTGFTLLSSHSAQECYDLAVVAHLASHTFHTPFLHFFDGARTANEITDVDMLAPTELRSLCDLTSRASNPLPSDELPDMLDMLMEKLAPTFGHRYGLFEYAGALDAEMVVVALGSGTMVLEEVVHAMNTLHRTKVGVVKVHLYRPWSPKHFLSALPATVTRIAVLERLSDVSGVGGVGGPLFNDVLSSFHTEEFYAHSPSGTAPMMTSGIYGGSSINLTPAMVKAVFDNLGSMLPRKLFVLPHTDGVAEWVDTHEILPCGPVYDTCPPTTVQSIVWQQGGDSGNSFSSLVLSLLTRHAQYHVQGYLLQQRAHHAPHPPDGNVKKNSDIISSHIRFGPLPVKSPYLVNAADLIWISNVDAVLAAYNVLEAASSGAVKSTSGNGGTALILDCDYTIEGGGVDERLPPHLKRQLAQLTNAALYVVSSSALAHDFCLPLPTAQAIAYFAVANRRKLLRDDKLVALVRQAVNDAAAAAGFDAVKDIAPLLRALNAAVCAVNFSKAKYQMSPVAAWMPVNIVGAVAGGNLTAMSEQLHPRLASSDSVDSDAGGGTFDPDAGCGSWRRPTPADERSESPSEPTSGQKELHTAESLRYLMFKEEYGAVHRSTTGKEGVGVLCVSKHQRLTPATYDRNIFHLEIDLGKSGLEYTMGDALAVHGHNDEARVEQFLSDYELTGEQAHQVWGVNKDMELADGQIELCSVRQLLTTVLDIFGRPSKGFYRALANVATNPRERRTLLHIVGDDDKEDEAEEAAHEESAEEQAAKVGDSASNSNSDSAFSEFESRVAECITFADLLLEFPSAKLSVPAMIDLIPRIKPRLYSIASSMSACPTQVHLLVVLDDWNTPAGKYMVGHTSSYLSRTVRTAGSLPLPSLTCSIKPSLMKLPLDPMRPVVMAGTGTGMAPFRAFLQEKGFMRSRGQPIGPTTLYFGARYSKKEFLYEDDITRFHREGILTNLRLAWSRDQAQKVYIQHKIAEDAKMLWDYLVVMKGSFYLCGQAGKMPKDVTEAIVSGFCSAGGVTREQAEQLLQEIREDGRYVMEVY